MSSGPESLKELHHTLREVLDRQVGEPISVTTIVDIMNLIGRCVVSGNVRQLIGLSALCALVQNLLS